MDAIKIVLENGYSIGSYEIVQIFDIIGLRSIDLGEENLPFMEFIYGLARLFRIDLGVIKAYFIEHS